MVDKGSKPRLPPPSLLLSQHHTQWSGPGSAEGSNSQGSRNDDGRRVSDAGMHSRVHGPSTGHADASDHFYTSSHSTRPPEVSPSIVRRFSHHEPLPAESNESRKPLYMSRPTNMEAIASRLSRQGHHDMEGSDPTWSFNGSDESEERKYAGQMSHLDPRQQQQQQHRRPSSPVSSLYYESNSISPSYPGRNHSPGHSYLPQHRSNDEIRPPFETRRSMEEEQLPRNHQYLGSHRSDPRMGPPMARAVTDSQASTSTATTMSPTYAPQHHAPIQHPAAPPHPSPLSHHHHHHHHASLPPPQFPPRGPGGNHHPVLGHGGVSSPLLARFDRAVNEHAGPDRPGVPRATAGHHAHELRDVETDVVGPGRNFIYATGVPSSASAPSLPSTSAADHASADKNKKRLRISRACQHCKMRKTRCDAVGALPGDIQQGGGGGGSGSRGGSKRMSDSSSVSGSNSNTFDEGGRGAQEAEGAKAQEEQKTDAMIVVQPCTNCVRSGIVCCYSKRQLKRGPSKGYIKDLERRLDSLESHITAAASSSTSTATTTTTTGPAGGANGGGDLSPQGQKQGQQQHEKPEERLVRLENALSATSTKRKLLASASPEAERNVLSSSNYTGDEEDDEGEAYEIEEDDDDDEEEEEYEDDSNVKSQRGPSPKRSNGKDILALFVKSDVGACVPVVDPTASPHVVHSAVLRSAMVLLMEGGLASPEQARSRSAELERIVGQACISSVAWPAAAMGFRSGSEDSLRAFRELSAIQRGNEADALILCYLAALSQGRVEGNILAAATSKLTVEDGKSLCRQSIAATLDCWHSLAFNTSQQVQLPPAKHSIESLVDAIGLQKDSSMPGVAGEMLKSALIIGELRHTFESKQKSWEEVSSSDVEIMINNVESSRGSNDRPRDLARAAILRPIFRDAIRLHHRLHRQQSLFATSGGIATLGTSVAGLLFLLEGICGIGSSTTTSTEAIPTLLRCFAGPHVIAIASTALAFITKFITYSVAHAFDPSVSENVRSYNLMPIRHPQRQVHELLQHLAQSTFSAGREGQGPFRSLYLRLSAFLRTTIAELDALGDLSEVRRADDLPEKSPARRGSFHRLETEAVDFVKSIEEMGPLGLILCQSSEEEAFSLLPPTTVRR